MLTKLQALLGCAAGGGGGSDRGVLIVDLSNQVITPAPTTYDPST